MLSTSQVAKKSRADRLGIWASGLCAVHCALSPLLIILTPALASWWVSSSVHILAAMTVIPLAGFALLRGWRRHNRIWPLFCVFIAALCIILGLSPFTADLQPLYLTWGTLSEGMHVDLATPVCCPTVQMSSAGGSLLLPWVTLLTMFGSLLLILAHAVNLALLKRSDQQTCCVN